MRAAGPQVFALTLFALGVATGEPGVRLLPSQCNVEIVLPAREFQSSAAVHPTLVSHGPDMLHIPRWWPRGYRIERLPPAGEIRLDASPTVRLFPRKEILRYSPERYRFSEPTLLALSWRQVAENYTSNHFTVPPGRYRLNLTFALADLRKTKGKEIPLCTVYSEPFTLLRESAWDTFE